MWKEFWHFIKNEAGETAEILVEKVRKKFGGKFYPYNHHMHSQFRAGLIFWLCSSNVEQNNVFDTGG